MERRSTPMSTLSFDISKSNMVTSLRFWRAAHKADSFTKLARSAPEKPGVPRAITERSTSSERGTLRVCTRRISSRPFTSGRGTTTRRSKRPGRRSAGSRTSGRLVAAIRMTPSFDSKPSISTSNWFRVCSRSSCPAQACATMTSNRIDFIDEDDAGGILLALLKQVADAARAHAYKHFHEVGARNREERDVRFSGYGTGQQSLTSSRRPYQQHAFGNASTELLEFLRLAQKLYDLAQLFLGLFHAGHVLKRDFLLLHRKQPGATFSERECLVPTGLHLANHEKPECAEKNQWCPGSQQLQRQASAVDVAKDYGDALALQILQHLWSEVIGRRSRMERRTIAQFAANFHPVDRDIADSVLVYVTHEFGDVQFFVLVAVTSALDDFPEQ